MRECFHVPHAMGTFLDVAETVLFVLPLPLGAYCPDLPEKSRLLLVANF